MSSHSFRKPQLKLHGIRPAWSIAPRREGSEGSEGKVMHLSQFIREHMSEILAEWADSARQIAAPADGELCAALRNHAEAILVAAARDLDAGEDRATLGPTGAPVPLAGPPPVDSTPAERQSRLLDCVQLSSEFITLRTVVLALWLTRVDDCSRDTLVQVVRFSDAMDRALAASMVVLADRVQHARDMFDAILGHDLRGPLASIAFAGNMLARPGGTEQKAIEIGAGITRSARFMQGMVDDLLEFSRLRMSGSIPLRLEPVDVGEVCEAAVRDASAMHPGSQFELHLRGPLDACLDPHRMHQLLVNLLGNAGQHGAPDRPVHLLAASKGNRLSLRISNEGPAICEEQLTHIFDPLVRLEPGDKSLPVPTSLGLGLHIAREIALAHGGTIEVNSSSARTAFTVRLPRHAS